MGIPAFIDRVPQAFRQTVDHPDTLQANITKRCNLACAHCHVQAGPDRSETMGREVMQTCLETIDNCGFTTLDITGGSPEMNPSLEWLLRQAAARGTATIVRSNLVILDLEEYARFAEVYAGLGVRLVVSLPCYTQENTDTQRGQGTYDTSIKILKRLNALGYGRDPGLELDCVYNPVGAFLPGPQAGLEQDYKGYLQEHFGIVFDRLFTMTNNPLGRFAEALAAEGALEGYYDTLVGSFNPDTLPHMMCRSQLSLDYLGRCFDCDFNQAVGMPCLDAATVFDYRDGSRSLKRTINFGDHCYACCAGSGSSCGGATA